MTIEMKWFSILKEQKISCLHCFGQLFYFHPTKSLPHFPPIFLFFEWVHLPFQRNHQKGYFSSESFAQNNIIVLANVKIKNECFSTIVSRVSIFDSGARLLWHQPLKSHFVWNFKISNLKFTRQDNKEYTLQLGLAFKTECFESLVPS